jgi:hypothetical protein
MRILLRSNPSPDFPSRLAGAATIREAGLSIIGRGSFGSGFMTVRITEGNSIDGNLKQVYLLNYHLADRFAIEALSLGVSDDCLVA